MSETRRAAVIGSGLGGLAAALRLQAAGFATTCFEAAGAPGGRAVAWSEGGYTFDFGPTVITAPSALEELAALAGKRLGDVVELLPVRPYYRLFWPDGEVLDYGDDLAEVVRRRWPEDAEGYARFERLARQALEAGWSAGLVGRPFSRPRDMLRAAPALLRVGAHRSVWDAVASAVRAPHLREALSFHTLLVGGSPTETSSLYALIHALERAEGVHFACGGTGALVQGLVRLFRDLGGELRLGCPVRRVRVERGGRPRHLVESAASGARRGEPFDLVVSNADVHHTYAALYRDEAVAAARVRRLEGMAWSMSLVVVHVGTRTRLRAPAHHSVLFGRDYLSLLEDVFHGSALPRELALYVHAPGVTDRSLAPPEGDVAYVLCPVPHLGHAALDWDRLAEPFADTLLEAAERAIPDLRRDVVLRRIVTPRTFLERFHAFRGAAFSVAPRLTQSAWLRPHNRDSRIPGLYLVGAGTHPGAGVPGVISSAKAAMAAIRRDFTEPRRLAPKPRPGGAATASDPPAPAALRADFAACRRVIAVHSKSFALASRLFAPAMRDEVCALYAGFRRFDDAVDHAAPGTHAAVVERLRDELADLYAGAPPADATARAFQAVVLERAVPREYFYDFLAGLAMDAAGARYETLDHLLHYAWCVAGTVGLVLCHVMGVEDEDALPSAAHLGIAMQLTNVARDVAEDWERGRLYLPAELLPEGATAALRARLDAVPEASGRGPEAAELLRHAGDLAAAVLALLRHADGYYASADHGLARLGRRPALAVAAARQVYAAIGDVLRARGGSVLGPRAVVPRPRKLALLLRAAARGAVAPRAAATRAPRRLLRFEELPRAR